MIVITEGQIYISESLEITASVLITPLVHSVILISANISADNACGGEKHTGSVNCLT